MARKRAKKKVKWAVCQIEEAEFTVEKSRSNGKKPRGWMKFEFIRRKEEEEQPLTTVHKMQLISAWVDEEENNVIRALVHLNRNNPQNFSMIRDASTTDFIPVKSDSSGFSNHCISVNTNSIYFGPAPGERYMNYNSDESYTFYRSRPEVMREIFSFARDSRKQIGGDKLIALDRISSKLLLRFGFTQVPDLFGNSPPMWKGDVSQLVRPGRGGAWRDSRNMLDDLLTTIQKAI